MIRVKKILCIISLFINTICYAEVELGIDRVFYPYYFKWLQGKRIGLVANNASVNSKGQRDIDLFFKNHKTKLLAIFTPEHGLEITLQLRNINKDPVTNVPVYSLYGKNHQDAGKIFKNLDVIVFDLQDIGLRYYTYIAVLARTLNLAKKYNKRIIVLDRVNPLGGVIISGATVDTNNIGKSTSYFNIPTRYGLTIGELALYANKYNSIGADLKIVPLKNWQRKWLYNQTGLKWVPPSPRLQTFQQAYLYALFGTLDSTYLSVGLGQMDQTEYHYYGAPYITTAQAQKIVKKMQDFHLPGLTFNYKKWRSVGIDFTGQFCQGVNIRIKNYKQLKDFYSLVIILRVFQEVLGKSFILGKNVDSMLGRKWVREDIVNNVPIDKMMRRMLEEDKEFIQRRKTILLYKDTDHAPL